MKLGIIGGGALGIQLAHLAEKCGYSVMGFFDDTKPIGEAVECYSNLGSISTIEECFHKGDITHLVCAIGYKHFDFREKIFIDFFEKKKIPFATLIDPSCIIDSTAQIGHGAVLYAGCVVDKNVIIEDNVLLNLAVCVSHNSVIGAHSYLSPRCAIAGNTIIQNKCFLGINSTIIDDVLLSSNTVIAAGAVVTTDCNVRGLYAGVPASYKKEKINFK